MSIDVVVSLPRVQLYVRAGLLQEPTVVDLIRSAHRARQCDFVLDRRLKRLDVLIEVRDIASVHFRTQRIQRTFDDRSRATSSESIVFNQ